MFGNRVKTAREKLGLTLAEASRRSKMSPQKFQDAENGADSRGTTVAAIARGLDVSADFLLGVVPEPRLLRSAEALPRQIVARASQSKGMPQWADSNDPSVDDVRERLDELLSSGGTSGPDLNDGPFKLLGLNDRAQRVAFHAIVAGNLLPFVELLAQTRKATQALLAEPSLSEDVRRRAIEALGP